MARVGVAKAQTSKRKGCVTGACMFVWQGLATSVRRIGGAHNPVPALRARKTASYCTRAQTRRDAAPKTSLARRLRTAPAVPQPSRQPMAKRPHRSRGDHDRTRERCPMG